jgi:predicted regulator of Ras-like GTPase activity (Roadblock/LC7/MglB family)
VGNTSAVGAQWAGAALFDAILGESAQVALLLDTNGLVVAGRYETADGADLGSVIGAHLSGVSDEATRAMRHFGLGAWTRMQLESEAATIVMAPADAGVTLVAAPREVPLGFVRRTLDRCAAQARAWLAEDA